MNKIWYSKQWDNAPMPNAIFFTKDGHAIHGTLEVKKLGKPASHGCVRLSPENAATLYALVEANGLPQTQVVLTGTTPGGEGPKVASPGRWPDYGYGDPPWFGPGYRDPPRKRRSAACSDGGGSILTDRKAITFPRATAITLPRPPPLLAEEAPRSGRG